MTLRSPPPLERPLDVLTGSGGGIELREDDRLLATARAAGVDVADVPRVSREAAEEAAGRTPYDEQTHNLPTCFVCGPARGHGDGLRIFAGPLQAGAVPGKPVVFAASWVPHGSLSGEDGYVAPEFIWAALDCPTGYCSVGARHLGLNGDETALLGRMAARIERRPRPGDPCVVVAWPTGREGRKLFAESALLDAEQEVLATARATWLLVNRQVQLGASA
ncbi:PaaI family thioesterase [Bradyrhizobium sp. USDA 4354]